uniref:Uncharacterized protein n=1 Tax=Manihot esculenta TaxID=3983 RepID=A0A2C9URY0_MANES
MVILIKLMSRFFFLILLLMFITFYKFSLIFFSPYYCTNCQDCMQMGLLEAVRTEDHMLA